MTASDPSVGSTQHGDFAESPPSGAIAGDVQQHLNRGGQLTMQRTTIQAAQSTQRLQPSRDLARIVGMHCARAAVVAGVERREQIDHFGAPDLADDDAVRPHPQCLPDELAHRNFADAFDVGASRDQPDQMRMRRRQFRGVLDAHDPLVGRDRVQHRRQQCRLAGPGAAGHQETPTWRR